MTLSFRRAFTLMALVAALVSGCGSSRDTSTVTDAQISNLESQTNQVIAALTDAGYVALAKQVGDNPSIMFRKCDKDLTTENCMNNQGPSVTSPDVYLAVKDADAPHLVPTGTYNLLFAASTNSNPSNGLRCRPLTEHKLSPSAITAFAAVGKKFHELNYKAYEGGSSSQTKQVSGMKWRCGVTFGQYL